MSIVSLKTELRQQMKLTPQLLQSIELLQMNSQELLSYLGRMAEENPTLELQDAPDMADSLVRLRQRAAWLDAGVPGSFRTHREDSVLEPGAPDRSLNSLSAFLCDQLDRRHLSGPLLALTKYMVQLLDEDGYLAQEDLDGLAELKIPQAMVEQALGISMAELRTAEKAIAALEPRPGRAFQPQEPIALARPDVFVLETDGELQVVLNEFYLPKVSVSSYYSDMSRSVEDQEARAYLKDKLRQAAWLLDSLERRGNTLQRCAQAILNAQQPFFLGRTTELAPMKLTSLAEALELHPSTVSRAVRDKYLQCRQGTYPLRYFLSRPVGPQGISRQAAKQRLLIHLRQEDPAHPLSDQALCALLEQEGIHLARRTVAKYRMEQGVGSSAVRRV